MQTAGTQANDRVRRGFRGDVQGLRALAVIVVVLYHADTGLTGGYVGVDVFFVISGFVITRVLHAELDTTGRIELRSFYQRRVRRLLPALAVMLVVVLLASVLLAAFPAQQSTARTGAAASLFNANTYLYGWGLDDGYFDADSELNPLLHTWSLAVEEQFYLLFPALLTIAWAIGRTARTRARSIVAVVSAVSLTSLALALWLGFEGEIALPGISSDTAQFAFYMPFTRAWEFGAGALVAFAPRRVLPTSAATATGLAIGGLALISWACLVFDEFTVFPGASALIPVTGTVALIVAGSGTGRSRINEALASRPAQRVGDLSYSWYLWHWPFIVFAAALTAQSTTAKVVGGVLSYGAAVASMRLVEEPNRRPSSAPRLSALALAVACIVLPLAASVVLEAGHRQVTRTGAGSSFEAVTGLHEDVVRGCDAGQPIPGRDLTFCTWPGTGRGVAIMVGDSNAGHFTEGFVEASNHLGLDAIVATQSSCPFIAAVLIEDGDRDERCERYVSGSLEALRAMQPDVVVVASSSDGYIESSRFELLGPDGRRARTPAAKAALWATSLEQVLAAVAPAPVVVVHPIPKFPGWDARGCAPVLVLIDESRCGRSESLAKADERRRRALQAEREAVSMHDHVAALDVAGLLCPDGTCRTFDEGVWLWRDGSHISIAAAEGLADEFEAAIAEQLAVREPG